MSRESLNDRWAGHVPPTPLEEYSKRYSDFFTMERRDGILEVRMHTDGGTYVHNWAAHNAWNRVWQDIGNDQENEVLILTGTGDRWFSGSPSKVWKKPLHEEGSEYIYQQLYDASKLVENFVSSLEIPTIAAINGPGVHTEFALLCDVTLAAEDADLMDPHFLAGTAPGDGLGLVLQALMGTKRAAYYVYTGQSIPAPKALELGLVNEVLARDALLERAWELAEAMMERPRFARRMTHAILARPWQKLISEDLGFHIAHQGLAMLGAKEARGIDSKVAQEAAERKAW
ncbi:enoyl-CoA hydratase/isomerase family protein [Streptomyces kroppenstedtii]|uniref:enoyl-CoA hydratase/isomerase family protein n=1 Tax=Streptomyces kroppenstedtii TaxID=3051181 RepID=UPI0028D4B5C1|nr:enoyl-CoA hydratase/isomerase family protein [Streptomyces sp. DSM 40484]